MPGILLRMPSSHTASSDAQRQREQAADADDQRRLAEDVEHDAVARKAERAQRGHFAEPLIHRHGEQHRDEQQRERDRDRRQHRGDLAEVGEAALLKLADRLLVGEGPEVGAEARRCRPRRRPDRRSDVTARKSARSACGVPHASDRLAAVVPAVDSSGASNGSSAIPTTRNCDRRRRFGAAGAASPAP